MEASRDAGLYAGHLTLPFVADATLRASPSLLAACRGRLALAPARTSTALLLVSEGLDAPLASAGWKHAGPDVRPWLRALQAALRLGVATAAVRSAAPADGGAVIDVTLELWLADAAFTDEDADDAAAEAAAALAGRPGHGLLPKPQAGDADAAAGADD